MMRASAARRYPSRALLRRSARAHGLKTRPASRSTGSSSAWSSRGICDLRVSDPPGRCTLV